MSYVAPLSEAEIARMRKLFDTKLSQLYNERTPLSEWRKMDWIEDAIISIETFHTDLSLPQDFQLKLMYEVEERNGVKILRKKEHKGNKQVQIIPIEDYFDVLYDAHIRTGHLSCFRLQKYLKSKQIYMPHKAVVWFLKYFNICQAHRLTPMSCQPPLVTMRPRKNIKDHHGFVELLDMRKQPDGEYVCVMHYRDISTNFTFLRPLRSPRIAEVADELLQLFLQIGCPSILHSPIAKSFTESVIQKLAVAWPDCVILCGEQMKPIKKTEGIEEGLRNWMRDKESSNWSLGVYAVAHQMNLKKTGIKWHRQLQTPFKSMLGTNPKKGLDTQGLMPVLKNIKNEEDLENILDLNYTDESFDSGDDDRLSLDKDNCVLVSQKEREIPTSSVTRQTTLSRQTIPRQPVRTYIKKTKIQDQKTLKIDMNDGMRIRIIADSKSTESLVSDDQINSDVNKSFTQEKHIAKTSSNSVKIKERLIPGKNTQTKPELKLQKNRSETFTRYNKTQIQLWNSQEIDLPIGPKATTVGQKKRPRNADATSSSTDPFSKIQLSFDSDESDSSGDIKNIDLLTEDVSGAGANDGHRSTVSEEIKDLRFHNAVKLEFEADDDLS